MASRKRKHGEFTLDHSKPSEAILSTADITPKSPSGMAHTGDRPTGNPIGSSPALPDTTLDGEAVDNGHWEIPLSKKAKKRKRKQEAAAIEESSGPSLTFPNKVVHPLRVKDLQALVLYVLSDGVAPTWVALKNGKQIDRVLVLMVPGMDNDLLSTFLSSVRRGSQRKNGTKAADSSEDRSDNEVQTTERARPIPAVVSQNPLSDFVVPVKAPGDPKTGRIHSPLQAMLISPEPKSVKGTSSGVDNVFAPVRTPVTDFVHSADELVEAEYPVHPALFTNLQDAELEKVRRQSAGQSHSNGWVDTKVASCVPIAAQEPSGADDVCQGMQVYALDCEMVLTTDDVYSLARISVLDWNGKVVLDKLVRPALPVKDYFTAFSGITEKLLEGVTTSLEDIQKELVDLFTPSTVLLGQSLESDFNALKMTHPFVLDTSMLYPHPRGLPLRSSLKFLSNKYLNREIQKGGEQGHNSVEDARAVLDLVKLKCEKGPKWGTMGANGESIFGRLNASGHRTAIVEHGSPQKGLGRLASIHVGCGNDEQIVDGITQIMSFGKDSDKVNFVWGRLRDMEKARGWNSNKEQYITPAPVQNGCHAHSSNLDNGPEQKVSNGTTEGESVAAKVSANNHSDAALEKAAKTTVANLVRIYDSLPNSTLFVMFSGPGDMREVNRLQDMQKQYKKEFKVKKWDELSVKWTDDEVQALKKAFQGARNGVGLVCLK